LLEWDRDVVGFRWNLCVSWLYVLTKFRWGTVMEIKVVTRPGSCNTWTHIVFRFNLPLTTKRVPVILMIVINGLFYASDPRLLSH